MRIWASSKVTYHPCQPWLIVWRPRVTRNITAAMAPDALAELRLAVRTLCGTTGCREPCRHYSPNCNRSSITFLGFCYVLHLLPGSDCHLRVLTVFTIPTIAVTLRQVPVFCHSVSFHISCRGHNRCADWFPHTHTPKGNSVILFLALSLK